MPIAPMLAHSGTLTVSFSFTESSSGPIFAVGFLRVAELLVDETERAGDDQHDGDDFDGIHRILLSGCGCWRICKRLAGTKNRACCLERRSA